MKFSKILIAAALGISFSSCAKLNSLMDTPSKLDDMAQTTHQMKEGMDSTNESIRKQTILVSLSNMRDDKNRLSIRPIPFDMLDFGKTAAEAFKGEEILLEVKKTLKKINEERVEDRYPRIDISSANYKDIVNSLDDDKLADLMMWTVICGFIPDTTLQEMIDNEAEQGAYQDVLFQVLMMRSNFNSELMLNQSVMDKKLVTNGKILKAIEYNQKVDFIAKLPFASQISLDISGFSSQEMNAAISQKLDTSLALKNWKRIASAAAQDFKANSFSKDDTVKQSSIQKYQAQYQKSMDAIQDYIKSWAGMN